MKNKETKAVVKWTTLSVSTELRPMLDQVMIKKGRKMTYNQIIEELCKEFLEK